VSAPSSSPSRVILLALSLAVAVALASLSACGGPQAQKSLDRRGETDGQTFEFSSGGGLVKEEPSDHEWNVRLRGDAFWVAQVRLGKSKEFGTFKLEADEANKLWKLVDDAEIDGLPSSKRKGAPDEISFFFSLDIPKKNKRKVYRAEIWRDDAFEDETLGELVTYLGKLIGKYTDQTVEL
jgi:hypothetical protein